MVLTSSNLYSLKKIGPGKILCSLKHSSAPDSEFKVGLCFLLLNCYCWQFRGLPILDSFPASCGLDQFFPIEFSRANILNNSLQFCQPGIILQYNSSSIAQPWITQISHIDNLKGRWPRRKTNSQVDNLSNEGPLLTVNSKQSGPELGTAQPQLVCYISWIIQWFP